MIFSNRKNTTDELIFQKSSAGKKSRPGEIEGL